MTTLLLVIHLMIAVAMIILVLLQRSEGGALGIGGAGGGLMSGRGIGNALTRSTAILAALFFLTSIGLTTLGMMQRGGSVLDNVIEGDNNLRNLPLAPAPILPKSNLPTPR
ncbi:MAG: preprotein translocase subunit SecG [Parvibaculales bacterium]